MNIHTYTLGQMQSHCYLLEEDGKALLIDPGDTADFLLEDIQRKNLELVGILATHGHFDHVMAVGEIQASYPDLPLHIHEKDLFLLNRLSETAKHFLGYDPVVLPVTRTSVLKKGKQTIGPFAFEVLETPGHTPGSASLYFPETQTLFSGDTLFNAGIGRYDFSYSDKNELRKSIEKLLDLPRETIVYSGHGEETSIDDEKDIIAAFF